MKTHRLFLTAIFVIIFIFPLKAQNSNKFNLSENQSNYSLNHYDSTCPPPCNLTVDTLTGIDVAGLECEYVYLIREDPWFILNPPDKSILPFTIWGFDIDQQELVKINTANCKVDSALSINKNIISGCFSKTYYYDLFAITDKIKESLTGRKWTFKLFPISIEELVNHSNRLEIIRSLNTRLIYSSYPDVINQAGEEKEVLNELISDYLYKDIFRLKDIRKPDLLETIVKALAFNDFRTFKVP